MNNFMNKPIVIVGLGKTGLSCARYFSKQGIPFSMIDTQDPHANELLSKAGTIVLSPGVPFDHPVILNAINKDHPPEIMGDIELFARAYKGPLVAITGSNGKSTVTTLVGAMATAAGCDAGIGGNLGTPVLDLLEKNHALYILELSSFQLESTHSLKPSVATILNLSPDHLDRYATMEDYIQAKARIFVNAEKVVLNRNDTFSEKRIRQTASISFGLDQPCGQDYGVIQDAGLAWLARGSQKLLACTDLKLLGAHNVANALAALALAESMDLPMASNLEVLRHFKGLAHRCEWVRTYQGITFINDSKGTNVGATLATLQGLEGSITGKWVLIAGGVAKNADFAPLRETIARACRALILIGEAAEELERVFGDCVPCLHAKDMEEAVSQAFKATQAGDGVLLSPMCASLDMFKNFEERGNLFKEIVAVIPAKAGI